jgi:hypothetical protein
MLSPEPVTWTIIETMAAELAGKIVEHNPKAMRRGARTAVAVVVSPAEHSNVTIAVPGSIADRIA